MFCTKYPVDSLIHLLYVNLDILFRFLFIGLLRKYQNRAQNLDKTKSRNLFLSSRSIFAALCTLHVWQK
jgi:hypothetical protein